MALNLSTLTSPATSGDVLQEALTTADFLEPCPVLRNLSRGSNKGGDAKQDVALNQPKALPLIDGKGYCYLPVTTGNAPAVTFPTIGSSDDFVLEMDVYLVDVSSLHLVSGSSTLERIIIYNSGYSFQCNVGGVQYNGALNLLTKGASKITVERTSGTVTLKQNGVTKGTLSNVIGSATFSHLSFNGQYTTGVLPLNGYIQKATLSIGGTEQLDVDFTATNVRHGDTKFACATGQVVTINQSGNDPATVIKKSVLRFDGANDGLHGLFANNINGGYMFAAFSVLGDGGEGYARVFTTSLAGTGNDYDGAGAGFSLRNAGTTNLSTIASAGTINIQGDMFDDARGDILHVVKIENESQTSDVNNASFLTNNRTTAINSNEFNIAFDNASSSSACIDLEFLALFPADSVPDEATATKIRNYINNRNNVFDLKDGFGYYFYDAQNAPVGPISSGSSSWNGRIVGSDLGDSDRYATQATANHQPVSDGFKVTFADNTDHLDIVSISQAGWQIVGTSLGTFAYRVNANAQVRLNLLGYRGSTSYRKAGDLYGVILLPESATGKDIQEARKLLIDRGAADGSNSTSYLGAWYNRFDIVEFTGVDMSGVVNVQNAWDGCTNIEKFGVTDLSNCNNLSYAWYNTSSLTEFPSGANLGTSTSNVAFRFSWQLSGLTAFPALDLSKGNDFTSAWRNCSALTSFPAGAKLGTEASNVNFTSAWQSSGLTSFELDLSTGTTFTNTFRSSALTSFGGCDLSKGIHFKNTFYLCSNLTEISASAKFGTDAVNVDFDSAFASTGLTSFPALDLSNGTKFYATWFGNNSMSEFGAIDASLGATFADAFKNCSALQSFPSEAKLGTNANNVVFSETWRSNGLTSFSTPLNTGAYFFRAWRDCSSLVDFSAEVLTNWNPSSITTGVFNEAWDGCSALSAISVENILTSIDASGKYATSTGASGGSALADAGIDIDYDGTTLSAATNAAVTSLKAKGWSIIVNNVTL